MFKSFLVLSGFPWAHMLYAHSRCPSPFLTTMIASMGATKAQMACIPSEAASQQLQGEQGHMTASLLSHDYPFVITLHSHTTAVAFHAFCIICRGFFTLKMKLVAMGVMSYWLYWLLWAILALITHYSNSPSSFLTPYSSCDVASPITTNTIGGTARRKVKAIHDLTPNNSWAIQKQGPAPISLAKQAM